MHRYLLALLPLGVLCAGAPIVGGADEPRAVITRAIEAVGGQARLSQLRATHVRVKGILHELDGAAFTGEMATQLPNQFKLGLQAETNGVRVVTTYVLSGGKAWERLDQDVRELEGGELRDMQISAYTDHVAGVVPLLTGDGYTLTMIGESKVQGSDCIGVLVKAKGKPDVKLHFDKADGYLVKCEHRRLDPEAKKEILYEVYYSDYRVVNPVGAEEAVVKSAKLSTEPAGLLSFLGKHSLDDARREKIRALIRQLGDPNFNLREKAKEELVAQGPVAASLLSRATSDPDSEIAARAKAALKDIGQAPDAALANAVIRLLAYRRSLGTAEALLAYLPSAPTEEVVREVEFALVEVALPDGKPNPALAKAVQDKDPQRRAAALAALGLDGKSLKDRTGRRLYLQGIKQSMKGLQVQNGKKAYEWEVLEVQLFHKLDDKVFAKP